MNNTNIIKEYYAAWERRDWPALEALLAPDFTFSSPNHDDHINTAVYKEKCWVGFDVLDHYVIDKVIEHGDEAVAIVRSVWKDGTTYRTAEYFKLLDGKVREVDGFWGFMPQDIPGMRGIVSGVTS